MRVIAPGPNRPLADRSEAAAQRSQIGRLRSVQHFDLPMTGLNIAWRDLHPQSHRQASLSIFSVLVCPHSRYV
ncbi:hypothetical protein, partial [Leisingera sp. McT4-56]|uniref:hypothetical protein n=1 Tax=Leisingera sp. McT4-56 TaxID=2881255 RepID=UPI001CF8AF92